MIGGYNASSGSLELRQPAKIFVPIAWLLAGPANPGGYFAFQVWGLDFDPVFWLVSVAIPLSIGCAGVFYFLHRGGFGLVTLTLLTILMAACGCAVTGPTYTFALWALMEVGIYLSDLPLWSTEAAIRTSGTFIRTGLLLVAIPVLPAAVLLRLIAFQREAPKKRPVAASTLGI